jgi:hypothetical protein
MTNSVNKFLTFPTVERSIAAHGFLNQDLFAAMMHIERRRSERSSRRFILMLLESRELLRPEHGEPGLRKILRALSDATRETDLKGWYKDKSVVGVIFTEIGGSDGKSVTHALLTKVTEALATTLSIDQVTSVMLSFHIFPEPSMEHAIVGPEDATLYPDR